MGESRRSEFQKIGEGVDGNFALGMASDCRSEDADHFIEEPLAGECKDDSRSDGLDIDRVNGAPCGVWGGIPLGGECGKIMGSAEERCSFPEGLHVQAVGNVPCAITFHRVEGRSIPYAVGVNFGHGGEARVEIRRRFGGSHDADGGRQVSIQRTQPFAWVQSTIWHVGMGGLGDSVNARIRAA